MLENRHLVEALIREFLARKGFKETLRALNKEMPRAKDSINNRKEICENLGISKLMRKNKEQVNPCRTIVEVLVAYLTGRVRSRGLRRSKSELSLCKQVSAMVRQPQADASGSAASCGVTSNDSDNLCKAEDSNSRKASMGTSSVFAYGISTDSFDQLKGLNSTDLSSRSINVYYSRTTPESVEALQAVIHGGERRAFSLEWRRQSFRFCEFPGLEYGLVQNKGGPCGLLAGVQAYALKHLFFSADPDIPVTDAPLCSPSQEKQRSCLSSALADILWKAAAGDPVKVIVPLSTVNPSNPESSLLLSSAVFEFDVYDNLRKFLSENLPLYQSTSGLGCMYFLWALVLSRNVDRILNDMDERSCALIGHHNYCTQELVNLILTGMAVSNTFDGVAHLGGGAENEVLLRGVNKQGEIGFLSLFEHYGSCQVGRHYKEPKLPIWLVCSESHFSVLFSTDFDSIHAESGCFDLYYYDGLARQDEEIRLTVNCDVACDESADALIPPLDMCIRTKWRGASVSWNGTEPIL